MSPRSATRSRLASAHRAGDTDEALKYAVELARAGAWNDRLVAATIVAYGAPTDPLRDRATLELARMEAVARLAHEPDNLALWSAALAALIATGQLERARQGVALAARDQRIGCAPWKLLVTLLIEGNAYAAALAACREACAVEPADAELQATRSLLCCEAAARDEAAESLDEAHRIDARHPMVWLARSRLAFDAGHSADAERCLAVALGLGAPAALVELFARPARAASRYGL